MLPRGIEAYSYIYVPPNVQLQARRSRRVALQAVVVVARALELQRVERLQTATRVLSITAT